MFPFPESASRYQFTKHPKNKRTHNNANTLFIPTNLVQTRLKQQQSNSIQANLG